MEVKNNDYNKKGDLGNYLAHLSRDIEDIQRDIDRVSKAIDAEVRYSEYHFDIRLSMNCITKNIFNVKLKEQNLDVTRWVDQLGNRELLMVIRDVCLIRLDKMKKEYESYEIVRK